jgi:hypothetical protein
MKAGSGWGLSRMVVIVAASCVAEGGAEGISAADKVRVLRTATRQKETAKARFRIFISSSW